MKQDLCAHFVRQEKIIRAALVPDRIHADRIGDENHPLVLRRTLPAKQLVEHVGIGRIYRHDHVRLEPVQHSAQVLFQSKKDAKIAGEFFLAIEPAIDDAPDLRGAIDHSHVGDPGPVVRHSVGFGKEIVQLDLDGVRRDLAKTVANPAGGTVVSLAVAGGQDQDIFHNSLGAPSSRMAGQGVASPGSWRESLMDICVRQSKVARA